MKSGFLANFGYRCRILEVKKRKIIRISLGIHFWGLENATVRGSHGLSARRARRTKSRRPEGPKGGPKGHRLEVGARRAPKLLVSNKWTFSTKIEFSKSLEFDASAWIEVKESKSVMSKLWYGYGNFRKQKTIIPSQNMILNTKSPAVSAVLEQKICLPISSD